MAGAREPDIVHPYDVEVLVSFRSVAPELTCDHLAIEVVSLLLKVWFQAADVVLLRLLHRLAES